MTKIRKLMISAYSKFFNKSYYKMGEPYIGKQCDTLNKMAVASLLQDQTTEAEEFWTKSLDLFPCHFDSQVNYELFRWRYAFTSDEDLMSELKETAFRNKQKGEGLKGLVQIALGEKQQGIQTLESFINKKQDPCLATYTDPSENLRRKRAREIAQEVF